jgi:hypothetical protein
VAAIQLINGGQWVANPALLTGQSQFFYTSVLYPRPATREEVFLSLTVQAQQTSPAVFSAAVEGLAIVSQTAGLSLNFSVRNATTAPIQGLQFSYIVIR